MSRRNDLSILSRLDDAGWNVYEREDGGYVAELEWGEVWGLTPDELSWRASKLLNCHERGPVE